MGQTPVYRLVLFARHIGLHVYSPPICTSGSAPALGRLGRGTPVPMPHPRRFDFRAFGASIFVPPAEAWCPPADLELATGLYDVIVVYVFWSYFAYFNYSQPICCLFAAVFAV